MRYECKLWFFSNSQKEFPKQILIVNNDISAIFIILLNNLLETLLTSFEIITILLLTGWRW